MTEKSIAMIKQANTTFTLQDFGRLLFKNRKLATAYGVIALAVAFNLCLFLPANYHNPAAERMVNALQLLSFGIMGIANVWMFYKSSILSAFNFSKARIAFVTLLFVLMALILFLYYYFSGHNELLMAFASSGAFLLPFLLYQGWLEIADMPGAAGETWYLPEASRVHDMFSEPNRINNLDLQIKIAVKANKDDTNRFPFMSSGKTRLGKAFEKFIDEQSQSFNKELRIETKNGKQCGYAWQFFEERYWGLYTRVLYPSKTLLENNLRSDAIIHVKRIAV